MHEDGTPVVDAAGKPVLGSERDARQVFDRLAGCWTFWGKNHGYFKTAEDATAFHDEMCYMLAYQMAAPNSPQWFNTGLHYAYGLSGPAQGHFYVDPKLGEVVRASNAFEHPQPHACFIQSIEDDLVNENGIMDLWVREARLFKYGSGTGTNFSRLRGDGESLSGGGRSSGLMSFLKIGDRAAGAIKSGGTTRRAAKMVCLDLTIRISKNLSTGKSWRSKKSRRWSLAPRSAPSASMPSSRPACSSMPKDWPCRIGSQAEPVLKEAVTAARRDMVPEAYIQRMFEYAGQGYTHFVFHEYDTNWDGKAYQTVLDKTPTTACVFPTGFLPYWNETVIGNSSDGSTERSAKRSRRATSGTRSPGPPGFARIPARNTTRLSMNGIRARKTVGSMPPIPARNTCSWTIRPAISPRSISPSSSIRRASSTWILSAMRCASGRSRWKSAC